MICTDYLKVLKETLKFLSKLPGVDMTHQTEEIYEFGVFEINVADRTLRRDGEVVALTPKVFEVLLMLVRNRERVLEKEELMRVVWADTSVEEANLTQSISMLRKALGE